jgi:hypothetical protein
MKRCLSLVLVVLLVSARVYYRWQRTVRAAPANESHFVTPLGVIPLQNNVRVSPELHNGYIREESHDPRFQAKVIVSLSADQIEPFVKALAPVMLPERAYAILSITRTDVPPHDTRETYLTPFTQRDRLVAGLEPYFFRLVHDGNVAFGLGWYDKTRHEEIFVGQKKIITVMTSRPAEVEAVLYRFGVEPFTEPRFITNYETTNGDLRSFADVYPDEYGAYRSEEYLTAAYTPGLIRQLGFKKN